LLRDTLAKAGKAGIASVVIRTKQYLAALVAQDELLVLNTLRYADELKDPAELKIPEARVTAKELDMAMRLVEDMADEWRPSRFKDTFRADLLKRIKEKVKKGETEEITEAEKEPRAAKSAEVIDLMQLLKKSVEKKQPKRAKRRRAA
ncbi:MAG TPA: Ku protein, partial [Burkholderiales bacterium]